MRLPLHLYQYGESFGIRDELGVSICHIYFDDDPKRADIAKRLSREEAESIAKRIARMLTDEENAKRAGSPDEGTAG